MQGDFSVLDFDPHRNERGVTALADGVLRNVNGVLYQQGRVTRDADLTEGELLALGWDGQAGRDIIGAGVAAVPATEPDGFKIDSAFVSGSDVHVMVKPGRVWADGILTRLAGAAANPSAAVERRATYFGPPLSSPLPAVADINDGVRDAVILEVSEEALNGYQYPDQLIEPALGGPDTAERAYVNYRFRLLRLGADEDCDTILGKLADDPAAKGKLSVTLAPVVTIGGDCPVVGGGGYTGFEHNLYRVEIAETNSPIRFKWSQWNAGLAGCGRFDATVSPPKVTLSAGRAAIVNSGLGQFYLEALQYDDFDGAWKVIYGAMATLNTDHDLELIVPAVFGTLPSTTTPVFFRLWNGIENLATFTNTVTPVELRDGIRLAFDAPVAGNYRPGDYWTFAVRAGEIANPAVLIDDAPPTGIIYHRVPLAEIDWTGRRNTTISGTIEDCRPVFLPLTKQKGCCTFTVGDGLRSHGDFDSIEAALRQLPASGGEICLLPGLHQTNAVIRGKRNVRIHGCHTETKVVPRKDAPTDPIFRIIDSIGVALERMDMVTLGGTAILAESERPGGVADIEIADNRILACQNAIRVINAAEVTIHHNRIRMLDKRDSDVAIYLAGDDSLIERNDIRLLPAPAMPPLQVPDRPKPIDPNDPCAELEVVYLNPRIFMLYVEKVWLVPLMLLPLLKQPHRAPGGIQIAGGSERVRVLANIVVGGAGNGITLGDSFDTAPQQPALPVIDLPVEARILGRVVGPDGKPVAGAHVTLTRQADGPARTVVADQGGSFVVGLNAGKYTVDAAATGLVVDHAELSRREDFQLTVTMKAAESQPDPSKLGFMYQITIEGNNIAAMGLSGIGVPQLRLGAGGNAAALAVMVNQLPSVGRARALLGNPVIGLTIRQNRIVGCLRNPFDNALQAEARLRGLGGISLGLCEDVAIVDNRIEANGTTAANPTCGVFIYCGEAVDVIANHVVGNGPLPAQADNLELLTGRRGGIVLNLVSSFNLLGAINAGGMSSTGRTAKINPRPAARVHENIVDQPAGHALYIAGFGPLSCTDNSFNSELSGPSPMEGLAGTVFIYNAGGTQKAAAGTQIKARIPAIDVGQASAAPTSFARDAAALALLPGGDTLFSDNQSRTGAANRSSTCQAIRCLDDLAYQGNQSQSDRAANLFSNVYLGATTLRAIGNRMSEVGPQTLMSLFTLAARMNDTSLNQGDHCIIATDQNPDPAMAELKIGNQWLHPGQLCFDLGASATLLFKPKG